ncbi:hypothetical protein [Weissella minor]|uniref:hypothetical protein n=1 Tax=Weissella minor TaxID=1620 RepID=UPI003AF285F1
MSELEQVSKEMMDELFEIGQMWLHLTPYSVLSDALDEGKYPNIGDWLTEDVYMNGHQVDVCEEKQMKLLNSIFGDDKGIFQVFEAREVD